MLRDELLELLAIRPHAGLLPLAHSMARHRDADAVRARVD